MQKITHQLFEQIYIVVHFRKIVQARKVRVHERIINKIVKYFGKNASTSKLSLWSLLRCAQFYQFCHLILSLLLLGEKAIMSSMMTFDDHDVSEVNERNSLYVP